MPGPYRSKLKDHTSEIARLRKTRPPTPYSEIARILKTEHGLDVSPSSIWSFVKARSAAGGRKIKYAIIEEGVTTQSQPDASSDDVKEQYLKDRNRSQPPLTSPLSIIDPSEEN